MGDSKFQEMVAKEGSTVRVLQLSSGLYARPLSQGCAAPSIYTPGQRETTWNKVSYLRKQHNTMQYRDQALSHRFFDLLS